MKKLTRYSVTVAESVLARYPLDHLNRAAAVINGAPIECAQRERLEHLHAVRYTGIGPPEVVTLLAAMAQGHPLGPILDELEGVAA